MVAEETDVVVVGAGGGGAVLGLALAQRGIRTIVLEQAAGPPAGLRGEILQPNGQRILDQLGVLHRLPASAVKAVRHFHFCRAAESSRPPERLYTVDYGTLPAPYDRAVVTLPNVAHHAILQAFEAAAPGSLRYGVSFRSVVRDDHRVTGVVAEQGGETLTIRTNLVIGADGALSQVRQAIGFPTQVHLYKEGYLIALLDQAEPIDEAWYYVGARTILGLFPAAEGRLYLFYMIPADSMNQVKAQGLEALRTRWTQIAPQFERTFRNLTDWGRTAYMPTGRVRTSTWVADGAALIGDAAHAMNPHASQGRMQAMADAMTLADLIPKCLEGGCSAEALQAYERRRRPQVDMLQRLADEQVLFWNSGNPIFGWLRDRVFRTLDRNRRLRHAVLETTAGLRESAPFGWLDRLMAAGLLPDPNHDRLAHH